MASLQKSSLLDALEQDWIQGEMFVQIFLNKHTHNPISTRKDDFIRVSKPIVAPSSVVKSTLTTKGGSVPSWSLELAIRSDLSGMETHSL